MKSAPYEYSLKGQALLYGTLTDTNITCFKQVTVTLLDESLISSNVFLAIDSCLLSDVQALSAELKWITLYPFKI